MNIAGIGWVKWKGLLGFAGVLLAAFSCGSDPEQLAKESRDEKELALAAPECTADKRAAILAQHPEFIDVDCSLHLQTGENIGGPIRLAGDGADDVTIDCAGRNIGSTSTLGTRIIQIESLFKFDGGDDYEIVPDEATEESPQIVTKNSGYYDRQRPQDIIIKNCNIFGDVRVRGLGRNGEAEYVRRSSWDTAAPGHTARARDAAPKGIMFNNVTIKNNSGLLYLAPGVTNFTLKNSTLIGEGDAGVAVYLDAESYGNVIENNFFDTTASSGRREQVAIDGSRGNLIINNHFLHIHEGVKLYRNCGEGGTIRVATPEQNHIINNYFEFVGEESKRAIWIARMYANLDCGADGYCNCDWGEDYGSSIDNRDFARYNVILQNQMLNRDPNSDDVIYTKPEADNSELSPANGPNYIISNQQVSARIDRKAGCFLATSFSGSFAADSTTVERMVDYQGTEACRKLRCTNGRLVDTGACSSSPHPPASFGCRVLGNNAGCTATATCPLGTKVIGAKAVCDLESAALSPDAIDAVPVGQVNVAVPSSVWSDGLCTVADTSVQDRADIIKGPKNAVGISASCREHDANGGDCQIMGELYCR